MAIVSGVAYEEAPTSAEGEPSARALGLVPFPQDYFAPVLPSAQVWRLRLLSSWGDAHYIGMDALQLFGEDGASLIESVAGVHVVPAEVNLLPDGRPDPRTVEKLFLPHASAHSTERGVPPPPPSEPRDFADVWLAPWAPETVKEVCLLFDEPVRLALLRAANYSKTPARGVRDFELFADDLLVFRGELKCAPQSQQSPRATSRSGGGKSDFGLADEAAGAKVGAAVVWQSLVFTDNESVIEAEAARASLQRRGGDEHVLLINDGKQMN